MKNQNLLKIKRTLVAAASLALLSGAANAAIQFDSHALGGPVSGPDAVTDPLKVWEKPYQLVYVGSGSKIKTELENSIYAGSFGRVGEKPATDSTDWALPGYARLIQVPVNGTAPVVRWDVKDTSATAADQKQIPILNGRFSGNDNDASNRYKTITNSIFLDDRIPPLEEPPVTPPWVFDPTKPYEKWNSLLHTEILQPLHAIDFDGVSKIVGSQTFLGRYLVWDLTQPVTVPENGYAKLDISGANPPVKLSNGTIFATTTDTTGFVTTPPTGVVGTLTEPHNPLGFVASKYDKDFVRVRLAKFSKDGKNIYTGVRKVEEDPTNTPDFKARVDKIPVTHINSNDDVYVPPTVHNTVTSTGHAIYVGKESGDVYTGGTDLRHGGTAYNILDGHFRPVASGGIKPRFLNIVVVEDEDTGKATRIYATNSTDIERDRYTQEEKDAGTIPAGKDVGYPKETYAQYIARFKTEATDLTGTHRHGLYVFNVESNGTDLKQVAHYYATQPVEIALDTTRSKVFFNDRIEREVIEIDTGFTLGAVSLDLNNSNDSNVANTLCHNSNLVLGPSNTLYVSSVWHNEYSPINLAVDGSSPDTNCNAIDKFTY